MSHEQLVEKVARAICHARHGKTRSFDAHANEYSVEARAALSVVYEAMREPTIEMVAAFWRQKNTGTQETGEIGPDFDDLSCARAMLAASPLNPEVK